MLSASPYLMLSLRDRSPMMDLLSSPVPLLDLATHPPRLIGMRPGLPRGRVSTVKSPPAGRLPHCRHHSLPPLSRSSTSATPSGCSKTLLTPCLSSGQPSCNLVEALHLFPFIPGPPLLTPLTTHLRLPPPSPSISRTTSPLPPLTPSSSPSPTPTPSAPSPCHPALTIWAEYLITHGGYDKNLLGPVRTVKKPRRYCLTPEQWRDEDEWMLMQIPMQGRRLTQSAYSAFQAHGCLHQWATHTI
jgi:hypothetical protein